MKMLMENAGSLVSRDRLIARLWDDGDFIDDSRVVYAEKSARHRGVFVVVSDVIYRVFIGAFFHRRKV